MHGDYGCMEIMGAWSWGSKLKDQFYELGFVIFMFCWRPCWEKQLHIWWQQQVVEGFKNAIKRDRHWSLTFRESMRNQLSTRESVR